MAIFGSKESPNDDDQSALVRASSVPPHPVPARRSVSLNITQQENIPSTLHYKSMLDVEEAPKLPATKPMTYDELYVQALVEPAVAPATRTLDIAKHWRDSNCQRLAHIAFGPDIAIEPSVDVQGLTLLLISCKRCSRLLFASSEGISGSSSTQRQATANTADADFARPRI
jgi:hypothetical protein